MSPATFSAALRETATLVVGHHPFIEDYVRDALAEEKGGGGTNPCSGMKVSEDDRKTCAIYCDLLGESGKKCVDSCKYTQQEDGACWLTPECGPCEQASAPGGNPGDLELIFQSLG
jgi:hypothetical protein